MSVLIESTGHLKYSFTRDIHVCSGTADRVLKSNDVMRRAFNFGSPKSPLKVATLQMKIISEDQAVETRTSELLFEWEKGKPVQGNVRPDVALNNLAIYEGKFSRLKEDRDNVARAKEALELMEPGLLLSESLTNCVVNFVVNCLLLYTKIDLLVSQLGQQVVYLCICESLYLSCPK